MNKGVLLGLVFLLSLSGALTFNGRADVQTFPDSLCHVCIRTYHGDMEVVCTGSGDGYYIEDQSGGIYFPCSNFGCSAYPPCNPYKTCSTDIMKVYGGDNFGDCDNDDMPIELEYVSPYQVCFSTQGTEAGGTERVRIKYPQNGSLCNVELRNNGDRACCEIPCEPSEEICNLDDDDCDGLVDEDLDCGGVYPACTLLSAESPMKVGDSSLVEGVYIDFTPVSYEVKCPDDSSGVVTMKAGNRTNLLCGPYGSADNYTISDLVLIDSGGARVDCMGLASVEVIPSRPGPQISVTGDILYWTNIAATAQVSCTDQTHPCDPSTYRLKAYSTNPGGCPQDHSQYSLTSPATVSSHSWLCGAAKNNNGEEGFSDPVEFKVDIIPPVISNISDNPDPLKPGINIEFRATITDNIQVSKAVVCPTTDPACDHNSPGYDPATGRGRFCRMGKIGQDLWSCQHNTILMDPGIYNYRIVATDPACEDSGCDLPVCGFETDDPGHGCIPCTPAGTLIDTFHVGLDSVELRFPLDEGEGPRVFVDKDYRIFTSKLRMTGESIDTALNKKLDIVLVNDISGSMDDDCGSDGKAQPGEHPCKINDKKDAEKLFIDVVISEDTSNKVSVVSYQSRTGEYLPLTDDKAALFSLIDRLQASGGTCIACGMDAAIGLVNNGENPKKAMLLMSDGMATTLLNGQINLPGARVEALNKAREAWEVHGIHVYTVAFGMDSDTVTMQEIAELGNGKYYYAESANISQVYLDIAREILHSYPVDPYLDAGSDTLIEWSYPGAFSTSEYTEDFGPYLDGLLDCTCPGCEQLPDGCLIDFNLSSDIEGIVTLDELNITGCIMQEPPACSSCAESNGSDAFTVEVDPCTINHSAKQSCEADPLCHWCPVDSMCRSKEVTFVCTNDYGCGVLSDYCVDNGWWDHNRDGFFGIGPRDCFHCVRCDDPQHMKRGQDSEWDENCEIMTIDMLTTVTIKIVQTGITTIGTFGI